MIRPSWTDRMGASWREAPNHLIDSDNHPSLRQTTQTSHAPKRRCDRTWSLPQGRDGGTVPGMGTLSDLERALLAIAAGPHPGDGEQERLARAELGLTATRYYQLLNELIDRPEALAVEPLLVARLRRLRDR